MGARAEERDFAAARAQIPAGAMYRKNPLADIMEIAARLLDGEILLREGKIDAALAALQAAVEREDKLRYAEPPAWAQPVSGGITAPLPTVSGTDISLRIARQTMRVDGKVSRAIGINGTLTCGTQTPDDWNRHLEAFRALGASHVSVNTMGAGLRGADAHIAALKRFKESI